MSDASTWPTDPPSEPGPYWAWIGAQHEWLQKPNLPFVVTVKDIDGLSVEECFPYGVEFTKLAAWCDDRYRKPVHWHPQRIERP